MQCPGFFYAYPLKLYAWLFCHCHAVVKRRRTKVIATPKAVRQSPTNNAKPESEKARDTLFSYHDMRVKLRMTWAGVHWCV